MQNTKTKKKSRFEPVGYKLLVKRSRAGLGLFAGEDIKKGTCVIEYVGKQISKEQEYTSRSKYLFESMQNMKTEKIVKLKRNVLLTQT